MLRQIQEIQGLATKYSKSELGRMVQMGLLDPQKAMMAGMMIDRIQQQNAEPPQTTVAQDVLGMPPAQAPQMPPQQMQQPMPAPQGVGVEALPAGNVGNYADGGIVAFDDGGDVSKKYKYGKYEAMAREAAARYGVDPDKFARLIETESHYKPAATSYAGKDAGLGIAQISKHHGLTDAQRLDPKFALNYAAKMFAGLVDKSGGDYRRALEKYKGVRTEKGRRRMEAHIAQVLGEEPRVYTRMAAVEPSKATKRRNPKIDTINNPFVEREPEYIPEYQPTQIADVGGVNRIAMLSAPYIEQVGGDTGEYAMPEDAMGGFAGGGIVALAGGGIPRYQQGGVPGQATTSAVPVPDVSDPYNPSNPTYAGLAWEQLKPYVPQNKLAGSFGELFSNMMPGNTQGTLRIDPKTGEPITLGEFMRRAEAERTGRAKAALPPAPAAAAPSAPAPQGTQKEFTSPQDVGASTGEKTLPPVEFSATREKTRSPFGLPDIETYGVNLPVETANIPEKKTADQFRAEQEEQYKKVGYDPEMFNNIISKIEERKGDAATEKDRAMGEAIMMAGIKLMGARKGQEFQSLSEGAQEGLKAYQMSMREFKNRQDKLDERIDQFRIADAQAKKTGADSAIANAAKHEEMVLRAEQEAAKAKNEAAYRAAYLATNLQGHDAQLFAQKIASDRASKTQAPAEIQLIERMMTDPNFAEAYRGLQQSKVDPNTERQLRLEYAKDIMLQKKYKTVDEFLRAMNVSPTSGWGELKVTEGKK